MFNSRNPLYRTPMGAVAAGTNVHFKIYVPRDMRCSSAHMRVRRDADGVEQELNLFWCGMDGTANEWWECDYTPTDRGLYFYDFSIMMWRGSMRISRAVGGVGSMSPIGGAQRPMWQLTVYEEGLTTPDWLAGGIMYQVFPDRFCNSGAEKPGIPAGRQLRSDWGGQPVWRPDEQGEITNSDYFGGDLRGILQKLPYLQSLGVTCLYLNPIFEAHSNHRYNTADYSKIDPVLGDEEDFRALCAGAQKLGIRVLLDGVFSHTGSDSIYFNREGRYPLNGAYNRQDSPYSPWYAFQKWPEKYDCWWNFVTLPNVKETNPAYDDYINGENGITRKWLGAGASGWRLDVADELPDAFIDSLTAAAKAQDPEALVLGEVWEDASNKTAYGQRRRYLLGGQLDTVMNYPFRDAVIGFLTGANPADMMEIICNVLENYPPQSIRLLMNHLGTHDTERVLTMLGGEPLRGHARQWQSTAHLTKERRAHGLRLLRLAAVLQYTLPGVPCIYYGDEAGMEGYRDPFNRGCYPWGSENTELIEWYASLGKLRAKATCLKEGGFTPIAAGDKLMAYIRADALEELLVVVSISEVQRCVYPPPEWDKSQSLLGEAMDEHGALWLPAYGCAVLHRELPQKAKPEAEGPAAGKSSESSQIQKNA